MRPNKLSFLSHTTIYDVDNEFQLSFKGIIYSFMMLLMIFVCFSSCFTEWLFRSKQRSNQQHCAVTIHVKNIGRVKGERVNG